MFSSIPGVMSLAHRASWLVLGLILARLPARHCQNELLLRSVQPPYPLSFSISQVAGSSETYGPTGSTGPGKAYRTLALHDGQLFVGGKAQLFSADPVDLSTFRNVSSPPDMTDNYIRVIQPLSADVLLECGTNGWRPYCQQRYSQNLLEVGGSRYDFANGEYVAPASPNQNTSWLLLRDSGTEIFAGTNLEITAGSLTYPAIVRARLQTDSSQTTVEVSLQTRTTTYVLNGPQFVGEPIEYNEHIFFFFREFAAEYLDGGQAIYSRVAIVCKNDTGGTTYYEDVMVTFVKARVVCSIEGDFDFHYNEIQDIYYSADDSVVFASFATSAPEVASSAVCAYRLDEIEALFQTSKFRGQLANHELWRIQDTDPVATRQATCPDGTRYSYYEYHNILNLGQLMADTAANKLHYESSSGHVRSNPLLVSYGERFTQIVVDEDVLDSIDVMFIGTENGAVLKAYLNENRSEARIVEEISLSRDGLKTPVLTMLKSAADQAVFVGTDIGVYKIPFQHCRDFLTLQTCLDARDPYCKWTGHACSNSAEGQQDLENGAGTLATPDSNYSIIILMAPENQTIVPVNRPDRQVDLYLVAEADVSQNLRVVGGEINCSQCASLPFTEYRTTSSGKEYLALHINGSSSENATCSCSCTLAIDSGVNKSLDFHLTPCSIPPVDLPACLTGCSDITLLEEFVMNIGESCDVMGNPGRSSLTGCW